MENETQATEQPVGQSTNEAVQTDTAPKTFEIPTEVQALVGEGKKYQSTEDALRSVPHAQKHIETLEFELAEVREELTRRKTTQELIDEIKSGVQPTVTTAPVGELNQDTVMDLVNKTLSIRERQSKAKGNADQVAKAFTSQYGQAAEKTYNSIANDLGLTITQLNELAAASPKLVLKVAGLTSVKAPSGFIESDVNTQALSNQGTPAVLSARVPRGASTKDLVKAWKAAGDKVKSQS